MHSNVVRIYVISLHVTYINGTFNVKYLSVAASYENDYYYVYYYQPMEDEVYESGEEKLEEPVAIVVGDGQDDSDDKAVEEDIHKEVENSIPQPIKLTEIECCQKAENESENGSNCKAAAVNLSFSTVFEASDVCVHEFYKCCMTQQPEEDDGVIDPVGRIIVGMSQSHLPTRRHRYHHLGYHPYYYKHKKRFPVVTPPHNKMKYRNYRLFQPGRWSCRR